jgi:hypothetical protein
MQRVQRILSRLIYYGPNSNYRSGLCFNPAINEVVVSLHKIRSVRTKYICTGLCVTSHKIRVNALIIIYLKLKVCGLFP